MQRQGAVVLGPGAREDLLLPVPEAGAPSVQYAAFFSLTAGLASASFFPDVGLVFRSCPIG